MPQELHSCKGIQHHVGSRQGSRAQDLQRDPVGVAAKGQEENNHLPQCQPSSD